ncbi:MAG: hypothetical protein HRU43_06290 [Simkaniaceae bacterium]|nr:hypothetical protein [Simkaniaceae bacterium]
MQENATIPGTLDLMQAIYDRANGVWVQVNPPPHPPPPTPYDLTVFSVLPVQVPDAASQISCNEMGNVHVVWNGVNSAGNVSSFPLNYGTGTYTVRSVNVLGVVGPGRSVTVD